MIRIGVDFGGTKIEAAAVDAAGVIQSQVRAANPGSYDAALETVAALVREAEAQAGVSGTVGVGAPGSVSPRTGVIRNANSVWLNGRALGADLERVTGRPVRTANDANCFALSEASDGAAAGARVVFGAILGTGCGGGVVVDGRLLAGRNGVAGEWGHTPLPWATAADGTRRCWCGRDNCLERYISGPGLAREMGEPGPDAPTGHDIAMAARGGTPEAVAALDRYIDRLGRALAVVVDLLDPDVIVFGGGMSNVDALYERVPAAVAKWVFSDVFETPILKAKHGDSSGVRGAAWLWPLI
jgi:fructokinase